MPTKPKRRWQTRIEVDEYGQGIYELCETIFIYGETIDALQSSVRTYLLENKPLCFSNIGDNFVERIEYCYASGLSANGPLDSFQGKMLKTGWWRWQSSVFREPYEDDLPENHPSQAAINFEAVVDSFIKHDLILEKGPDYQSKAILRGHLQLPLVEKILRETAEHPINDLIRRGWHIIALEYKGELSITGELTNRKAIFVMGHPEDEAASLTLKTKYFQEAQSKVV